MHETDDLIADLRELGRASAPPRLRAAVLAEVGLADRYARVETPIGTFFVAHSAHGISAVIRDQGEVEFERWFEERFGRPVRRVAALPERLHARLAAELQGRVRARIAFDLRGVTDFERDVLAKTLEIPRGEVRSYAWVAREIGRPAAVRAVGTALGHNPIALLIPCHRVVRSDGLIGEYSGGGPECKRAMLSHEGVDPAQLERLARRGIRYLGSDTTHVYCLPSCHHARRIGDRHRQEFRSDAAALAAGYRPCRDCRPAAAAG